MKANDLPDLGSALLSHARHAIAYRLGLPSAAPIAHPALEARGASFVTLTRDGSLRGCIGQLEAMRPLRLDVEQNAIAAAFQDPRFPPLTRAEWDSLGVEVSVLEPVVFADCPSEEDAVGMIEPGLDGVVLASGGRRATFLPQVWEQLPDPREFLARLREKAGLSGLWPADMRLGVYRVAKYRDDAVRG